MKRNNLKFNRGFTLLEILITTVLVFLLFTLIYTTFFSMTNITAEVGKRMKSSEITFRFLDKFADEAKCMIREEDDGTIFEEKNISFLTAAGDELYPSKITYLVERAPDNTETLLRKQENPLDGYSFTLPVMENCDNISFLFYTGSAWDYRTAEAGKITAVGLEIETGGENLFFPVKLYGSTQSDSK